MHLDYAPFLKSFGTQLGNELFIINGIEGNFFRICGVEYSTRSNQSSYLSFSVLAGTRAISFENYVV